jgi:hypothetical protein
MYERKLGRIRDYPRSVAKAAVEEGDFVAIREEPG